MRAATSRHVLRRRGGLCASPLENSPFGEAEGVAAGDNLVILDFGVDD